MVAARQITKILILHWNSNLSMIEINLEILMRTIFSVIILLFALVGPLSADTKLASKKLYVTCDGELREEIKNRIEKKKVGYVIYKHTTSLEVLSEGHLFKDCRFDDLQYWCQTTSPTLNDLSGTHFLDINRVTGEVLQLFLPDKPTSSFDNKIFEGSCEMSNEPKID